MKRGEEIIADFLRRAGLDAVTRDGWVFVTYEGDRLWIGAEYGASLDAEVDKNVLSQKKAEDNFGAIEGF